MLALSSMIDKALEKQRKLNIESDTHYSIEWAEDGATVGGDHFKFKHSFSDPIFLKRLIQSNQCLLKACNNKQRSIRTVLDLTGGWGMDGFIIAHNGREVTMLEQNQLIYTITEHALNCAKLSPKLSLTAGRIQILNMNSYDFLTDPKRDLRFDCIYLDPMFPQHKSTAKPSKAMQLLQQMTVNFDIDKAFKLALSQAKNRVVVKRPLKSAAFSDQRPDLVYREKTVRFDVYLTAGKS